MNQNPDPDPLLSSSFEKKYKETSNFDPRSSKNSKNEESKERISLGEFEEGVSNINIQEDFFFDAGEKRIVSVSVILKFNALYINQLETNDLSDNKKRIIFYLFCILDESWYINPKDLVGASINFPKRKIRFTNEEITEVYELKLFHFSKIKKSCSKQCYRVFSVNIH